MNLLSDKEWITLNDIILSVNSAENRDLMRKDFLTLLRLLITFDKAEFSLATDDFLEQKPYTIAIADRYIEEYGRRYVNSDSLLLFHNAPGSLVYIDSNICSSLFLKSNPYYKEYLKKLNTPFLTTVVLIQNRVFYGTFTLYRFESSGDFTERDQFILEQLKNHLANRLVQFSTLSQPAMLRLFSDAKDKQPLSPRETEIAELMIAGFSNQQIGEQLYISETTVKKHIGHIFTKLGIKNRIQLLQRVNESGKL